MNKNLVLFTASFPFGTRESFLETELPFLAKRFDCIRIISFGGLNDPVRPVADNCIVDDRVQCIRRKRILRGLLGLWRVLPVYVKDLFCAKPYRKKKTLKLWAISMLCTSYYLQSKPVKELRKKNLDDTVFYFYWGVIYNSIAHFFKGKVKMVSRFHGDWDLWDSNDNEGYKPIRKATIDALSIAAIISRKGESFFKENHPQCLTVVSHLGSIDNGIAQKSDDGIIRVLSCSSVYPIKRVSFIMESLKEVYRIRRIEWTHIGDGPDFEQLKIMVDAAKSDTFIVNLKGRVSHEEVMNYYKTHCVDLFINLSTNEGVPVAIMEAISFDVPIVATDVGGTSEIVNDQTGVLVSSNPTKKEVANAIIEVLENTAFSPRKYWELEFDAKKNYSDFAEMLYGL